MYLIKDLYMNLYAFHLEQTILTVLGQVDHGGQGGNAARTRIRDVRNVRNRPHPKTTLLPWCYLPNHGRFGYSEVLTWFRDGTIRGGR